MEIGIGLAIIAVVEGLKKVIPQIQGWITVVIAGILGILAGLAGIEGLTWFTGLLVGLAGAGGVKIAKDVGSK